MKCEGGLYPLKFSYNAQKTAFLGNRNSQDLWHQRLGHPSKSVVQLVLQQNNLPFLKNDDENVCNACQLAKSHQPPYSKSTHVSEIPLQLIFSDVWGPSFQSSGCSKYYVSFIDDYSKFTWIYLLNNKSDV